MLVDLPRELREALDRQVQRISQAELGRTTRDLSARYRDAGSTGAPVACSAGDVAAYAAYRLPATYAATVAAFSALREQRIDWQPRSMLDLGAGLGSGLWAASAIWPSLERFTALDAQPRMISAARELSRSASHHALRSAEWVERDLRDARLDGPYDLVLIAYVLAEVDPAVLQSIIAQAWSATSGALVVIEPGTPAGFGRVSLVRDQLAASGGFSLAPCPHDPPCRFPADDWCHFSVRLPRSRAHRVAKDASLGYEDEKFSYFVMARTPVRQTYARILRHPQIRKGHIYLQLCTPDGVQTVVVSKRDGELYNRARKASWGDIWELPSLPSHESA